MHAAQDKIEARVPGAQLSSLRQEENAWDDKITLVKDGDWKQQPAPSQISMPNWPEEESETRKLIRCPPLRPSVTSRAIPSSSYTRGTPEQPYHGYAPLLEEFATPSKLVMTPQPSLAPYLHLTSDEYSIITGDIAQAPTARPSREWLYEDRRVSQGILDYLHLGPIQYVRDHRALQEDCISLLLVVRDTRCGGMHLNSVEIAANALSIPSCYVHVDYSLQLVSFFDDAVRAINQHMILYSQMQASRGAFAATCQRGKVLVSCFSGNDDAAAVVAAYIMAMYNASAAAAIQFVCLQRFSCCFDERRKQALTTWGEIVAARVSAGSGEQSNANNKRCLDDVMELDGPDGQIVPDAERFVGRAKFAPFRNRHRTAA